MSTDLESENEISGFARSLRRARRKAGDPSYRELARRTTYSISSISRTLNGVTFPRWRFTELLLESCGVSEEQIGGYWRQRWLETAETVSPLGDDGEPVGNPGPAPAVREPDAGAAALPHWQECGECGSLVTNPLLHHAWHINYVRRPGGKATSQRIDTSPRVRQLSG
jgi:transcriptional regulator with XRE-family HTH domain